MPTVVIGTAGHIDHGKTTLLRALTGIDADRLPEERARGMTIDVGFAHLDLDDGTSLDFVDVPGHDRLVGNMLVGAGEIDAVLLVVAADDGARAQTLEHLELLDALGLTRAVVAITKIDVAGAARVAEVRAQVRALVDRTSLARAPIVEVASLTGSGVGELRHALLALRAAVQADAAGRPEGPLRLPIDRAFTVKGRGLVVTGTLRGGSVMAGSVVRVVPGNTDARVREVQVHHGRADRADGGRTAANLAGVPSDAVRRGLVLAGRDGVVASDRALVALRRPVALAGRVTAPSSWPPKPGAALQLHLWTSTTDARVRRPGASFPALEGGAIAAVVELVEPVAMLVGARAVLRDPGSSRTVASVTVLDASPPRGVARRRMTSQRLVDLASAAASGDPAALAAASLALHGHSLGAPGARLAADVEADLDAAAVEAARDRPTVAALRARLARELRRRVAVNREQAAAALAAIDRLIERLVGGGKLVRDGDRVVLPEAVAAPSVVDARAAARDRLVAALDADVPPPLSDAVRAAGCGPDDVTTLDRAGRIVRVDDDLAWEAVRYRSLRDRAVAMARREPLAPAAFRDAIGGNRRIVMPLLEDFDRKGFLRRTPAGHVPGPRA